MKKLDLSNIVEGVRELGAVKQFIQHIENAYVESLSDLTKGLVGSSANYIVLYGCVNSGSGLAYDISAGAILKDGEIYTVPAFVGTATGANVPRLTLVSVNTQLEYTDATSQNTLVTRTFAWVIGTSGSGLVDFSGVMRIPEKLSEHTIEVVIDGGGFPITTGQKGHVQVGYKCVITGSKIYADQVGSIVMDIWKDTYANFPPAVADTIVAAAKPTLSSQTKNTTDVTTWAKDLNKGDMLAYNVDSAATVTRVTLVLEVLRLI